MPTTYPPTHLPTYPPTHLPTPLPLSPPHLIAHYLPTQLYLPHSLCPLLISLPTTYPPSYTYPTPSVPSSSHCPLLTHPAILTPLPLSPPHLIAHCLPTQLYLPHSLCPLLISLPTAYPPSYTYPTPSVPSSSHCPLLTHPAIPTPLPLSPPHLIAHYLPTHPAIPIPLPLSHQSSAHCP